MQTSDNIVIISNPAAGQRSKPLLKAVITALEGQGETVELLFTEYPGHAVTLARTCADSGAYKLIVAAGGDGTIREVAEGLLGLDMPIGIIPAGTANVLARELGYMQGSRKSPKHIAEVLCRGGSVSVFPFKVQQAQEQHMGLCWVGAGFDAEVLKHINLKWKARFGRAAFTAAILKAMRLEPKMPSVTWSYRLSPESAAETGVCAWALITNIERYAGPFKLTQKTGARAKGLACLLFPKAGGWSRAMDQLLITFKPLDARGATRTIREGLLTLGGDTTPVQLDGDLIGCGPVTIEPGQTALTFRAA